MCGKNRSDKLVGAVYNSDKFGDYEIICYGGVEDVLIRFHNTGYVTKSGMQRIRAGGVIDRTLPNVYGVGYSGECTMPDIRKNRSYVVWNSMLKRCYSDTRHFVSPKYAGKTVSDFFLNYSNFHEWYTDQKGHDLGWDLDKDLLVSGNSEYSPESCVLVPKEINNVIVKDLSGVSEYYGVHLIRDKFRVCVQYMRKNYHLSFHDNLEEASETYIFYKQKLLHEVAEKWKGVVSDRCYNALINYSVIERIRGFGMKTYLDIHTDINENCRGMSSADA